MFVTITEMGDKVYSVCFHRNGRRRTMRMTEGIRNGLKARGHLLWRDREFGKGQLGRQAQYEVA